MNSFLQGEWSFAFYFLAVVLGVLLHFLTELKAKKDRGEAVSPKTYWTQNPYKTAISVLGSLVGYLILLDQGETTIFYYVMYGYISDEIPKLLGQRGQRDFTDRKMGDK